MPWPGSRRGPLSSCPDGESAERIKPLPIAALRLAADTVDDLRKLGFERIADLLATPRAPLTLRFGPELGRRLDQATGRTGEPIEPVRTPDIVEAQQLFAEPIGAAGDHRALRRQADRQALSRNWSCGVWEPGASICCSAWSTTGCRRSGSGPRSRSATSSG